jgi:hypothetical protein
MSFEVLTTVKMSVFVFRVVTACGLKYIPMFRKNMMQPSSRLKMETVYASETLVSTYKSTHDITKQKTNNVIKLLLSVLQ